jgi:hypothetical protein
VIVLNYLKFRDDAYAKFVLDYAASEDVIRELWLRIRNEYDTLYVRIFSLTMSYCTLLPRFRNWL